MFVGFVVFCSLEQVKYNNLLICQSIIVVNCIIKYQFYYNNDLADSPFYQMGGTQGVSITS